MTPKCTKSHTAFQLRKNNSKTCHSSLSSTLADAHERFIKLELLSSNAICTVIILDTLGKHHILNSLNLNLSIPLNTGVREEYYQTEF